MPPRRSDTPTARRAEYLAFIRAFTDRWGVPPSFEEIGRHFMTTAPSVNNMIKTLEARGFLARVPGRARTLRG
jgi:SOS-response transcriptional repressor LexA